MSNGKLFINGKQQDEPFTNEDASYEFGPVLVPAGDVLVLGDNRNHSLDGKLNYHNNFLVNMVPCQNFVH